MRPVAGPSGARGLIAVLAIYLFIESGLARPSDLVSNSTSNKINVPSPTVEPMKDVSVATLRADDRANATSKRIGSTSSKPGIVVAVPAPTTAPRVIKPATPVIRNSIQMVASQLLHSTKISTPSPTAPEIVEDVRTPPKMKHQLVTKNKPKKPEVKEELIENSHAGIAVPVSLDDIENEINLKNVSSSTPKEGLSTWILLSNPTTISGVTENQKKDKSPVSTTTDSSDKKPPAKQQNKTNQKKTVTSTERAVTMKRPVITSVNKSDLVASGSAMTENTLNKIKATVYANVQKNKNASKIKTTTASAVIVEAIETKAPPKKKNHVTTTQKTVATATTTDRTEENTISLEAKETEIELEVSTPAAVSKKPKRTSGKRKKNKKRRKPSSASKIEESTKVNSTKVAKPSLKEKPITTQIYNYLSREIMPSVGVGIVGLAGLVGIASYFLYPFTGGALRRNDYINDRKDDLYRHNAEEYANDGNGQPEEEMLGTVLAGIPANSNIKTNPYAAQTPHYQHPPQQDRNTEQNIRYRNVGYNSDTSSNNYNPVSSQSKSGVAHGIVYPENIHYNTHREDSQKRYSTYQTDSVQTIFGKHTVESPTAYDTDPSYDTSFSYENVNIDTTRSPVSSSVHLGGEDVVEHQQETGYMIADSTRGEHPQFIVGNVPKEIIEVITPAAVPEHGPRNLRIRRSAQTINGIPDTLESILQKTKENKRNEISNEIDDALGISNSIFGDDEESLRVLTLKPEPEFDNELFYKVPQNAPVPATKKPIYVYPVNTKTTTRESTTTVELKTETDPVLFLTTKNYENSDTTVSETDTTTHAFASTQWHTSNIDTTYIPIETTSAEHSITEIKDMNTQTDTTKITSNQQSTMDLTTEIASTKNMPDSTVHLDESTESPTYPSTTETEKMTTHEYLENHSTKALLSTDEDLESHSTNTAFFTYEHLEDSTNSAFVSTTNIATSTALETEPSSTEFKELSPLWDSQSQYTDHVYVTTVNPYSTETITETGRDLKETKPFTEYTTASPTLMDLSVEPMYFDQINKNEKETTISDDLDDVKEVATDVPSTTQDNYLFNEIDFAFNDLTTKKENIEITFLVEVTTPRVSSTTENEIKILTDDVEGSTVNPIKRDEIPTILAPVNDDIPSRYPPPPPPKTFSLFSFLKRLVEFKYRLGLSILQSTSETLARYMRGAEKTLRAAAKASSYMQVPQE